MAEALIGGAALGTAFGKAFDVLHGTVKRSKALMSKSTVERLATNLDRLAPVVKEISLLSKKLDLPPEETNRLIEQMNKANKLISEWSKFPRWKRLFKGNHLDKLTELDADITRIFGVDTVAHIRRDVLKLMKNLPIVIKRGLSCSVPKPPDFTVGLDVPMKVLKMQLLKEEKQQLLVTAAGGCGKTTLVEMLCQDENIQGI